MSLLIEVLDGDQPRSELDGGVGVTSGQPGRRRLSQDGGADACEPSPFGEEPRLEGGAAWDIDAFEELVSQAWDRDSSRHVSTAKDDDVDDAVVGQLDRQWFAAQRDRVAQRPPQLCQVPAQGTERVRGLVEQQVATRSRDGARGVSNR